MLAPLSPARKTDAGRRAFEEHLTSEAEEFGRTTPGACRLASPFDQPGAFDEPAKVLLVEPAAIECFDDLL